MRYQGSESTPEQRKRKREEEQHHIGSETTKKTNNFDLMDSYIWETSMSNWLEFSIKLMEGILENARNHWNERKG